MAEKKKYPNPTTGPYTITVYPGPTDGKRYPAILLLHGNGGFREPYGKQIRDFAEKLAELKYVTAVPGYYMDDKAPVELDINPAPHVPTLTAAIAHITGRKDVDRGRLGLIGYSLGAGVAMRYIGSQPPKTVQVLADFFGPVLDTEFPVPVMNPVIAAGAGKFPPTIMFHNEHDGLVRLVHSTTLDGLLTASGIEHVFVKPYDELNATLNHPFTPGGHPDVDSQKKTTEWFVEHLPPKGV